MNPDDTRRGTDRARHPARLVRGACAASLLGALLVACGGTRTVQPQPDPPAQLPLPDTCQPLSVASLSAPAQPTAVAPASAPGWSAPRVKGELLVMHAPGVSAQQAGPLGGLQATSVTAGVSVVRTPAGISDEAFAAQLERQGLRVQPNYLYQAQAVPNDPGFPAPTNAGLSVPSFPDTRFDQDFLERINVQCAFDLLAQREVTGEVKVAVLDTGVNLAHPDLQGRFLEEKGRVVGRDFCSKLAGDVCTGTDDDPSEVDVGNVGHGTGVIGIIGASTNNATGISGITFGGRDQVMLSKILPVKVFGADEVTGTSAATTASLIQGIEYAVARGARVINLSLGFPGEVDPALKAAIKKASDAGVLLVASAGNLTRNTEGQVINPGLLFPASDPNVLAVGALGRGDVPGCIGATPTSGQKAIDLFAPGGEAGGDTATGEACLQKSPFDILTLDETGFDLEAGTSVAAPQVSGVAALLFALKPSLSAAQVKSILVQSARTRVVDGRTIRILDAGRAVQLALQAR